MQKTILGGLFINLNRKIKLHDIWKKHRSDFTIPFKKDTETNKKNNLDPLKLRLF